ncbi:MAG: DUF3168 domain-containing protein [Pseudomonadota bacterium]
MTAAFSWPLQKALIDHLRSDAALRQFLGRDQIIDAAANEGRPEGSAANAPKIIFGDDDVSPWFDKTDRGALHEFTIVIRSGRRGFREVKKIAAAVSDALENPELALERGHLVRLQFLDGRFTRSDDDDQRQAELRYRAIVEDTSH